MVVGRYEVKIRMWSTAYVFNKGHRLRLAVSSSNSPRFSVNPNNGLLVREGGPLLVAENTVRDNLARRSCPPSTLWTKRPQWV